MDPSTASEVLEFLRTSVVGASESLQDWAWVLFSGLFTLSFIFSWGKQAVKGKPFDTAFFGEQTIKGVGIFMVIGAFFMLSLPWMEVMREAGMNLSGSSTATVDIGEIARQADTVTERVEETIDNLKRAGWIQTIQNVPEIIALMVLDGAVHFLYLIIALIAVWIYAKFMLGYLVGGVFIAGLGHKGTFRYGMTSLGYVLLSAMPLFLLAFLQGLSIQLLDGAILQPGQPASIPVLKEIIATQGFLVLMSVAAAAVPGEFMSSLVGTSGAPSASNAARSIAQGSNAVHSAVSQVMSRISSSGGGRSLPSPSSGGGGGGPSSVGNAPRLLPPPSTRP